MFLFPKTNSLPELLGYFSQYISFVNPKECPNLPATIDSVSTSAEPPYQLETKWTPGLGILEAHNRMKFTHWMTKLPDTHATDITIHALHRIGFGPLNGHIIVVVCRGEEVISFGGTVACPPCGRSVHWPLYTQLDTYQLVFDTSQTTTHEWSEKAPIKISVYQHSRG